VAVSFECFADIPSEDEISILLAVDGEVSPEERARGEMLLLAFVSARMLVNGGRQDPEAQALAALMSAIDSPAVLLRLVVGAANPPVRLVDPSGHRSHLGFDISCRSGRDISFSLKARGFGLFGGRKLRRLGPLTVFALVEYLALRTPEFTYYTALGATTSDVSQAFTAGELTLTTQKRVVIRSAEVGWSKLPTGDQWDRSIRFSALQRATSPPPAWNFLEQLRIEAEELSSHLQTMTAIAADLRFLELQGLLGAIDLAGIEFVDSATISRECLDRIFDQITGSLACFAAAPLPVGLMEDVERCMGNCLKNLMLLRAEISDPESRTNTFGFRFWQ